MSWFKMVQPFPRLSGHTYRQTVDKWESTRPRIINDYFREVKKRVWKKEISWQKFFLDFFIFYEPTVSHDKPGAADNRSVDRDAWLERILFISKDWILIAIYLIVFIQRERHQLNSFWQFKIVSVNSKIALHWWQ